MIDLNLVRTFVKVCETGSVTEAAASLRQPKSTVSRHLARLEDVMERTLVDRSHSGISLTPEGKRLFEQARDSIHLLEPIGRTDRLSRRTGRVSIQVPRYLARGPMSKVLRAYMAEEPDVTVECHSESRLADAGNDRIDVMVTVGPSQSGPMEHWPVGTVCARLYAAPSLFEGEPLPKVPGNLADQPFLSSCGTAGVRERLSLMDEKGNAVTVSPKVRLSANELDILLDAARDGHGFVQLPEFVGSHEVALGTLIPLLPDHFTDRFMVSVSLLSGGRNPAARSLVDFVLRCLPKQL